MIVCHCGVVNDTAIRDAVDAGASTLAGVCRTTGAGQDCGSCVFAVRALVCEHQEHHAQVLSHTSPEARDEAS